MHQVPNLNYKYSDLEPYIDEETMRIHHTKHHQAYVDKLNAALEQHSELVTKPLEELLKNLETVPEDIRLAVRNHGGGHWNHAFFWEILRPATESQGSKAGPREKTIGLIDEAFGNLEEFKKQFKEAALGRFGSGWAWVVLPATSLETGDHGKIQITTTTNQDTPISQGQTPIIGVDVWEHAYYLKYQNRRADYLDAFWQVLNWEKVEELTK